MKLKYQTKYFKFLLLCSAVLILTAGLLFSAGFYADPDSAEAFDIVFPNDGYLQLISPQYVSASKDAFAVYDAGKNRLYYITPEKKSDFCVDGDKIVKGLYLFGETALLRTAEGYFYFDLTLSDCEMKPIELPSPANISYLATDGNYLYAKSTGGYISVYDSSFTAIYNNLFDEALAGNPVIAPENGLLHVFANNFGNAEYYLYNLDGMSTAGTLASMNVTDASCGDYLFVKHEGIIEVLDKSTVTSKFSTTLQPTAFSAYGDDFYAIENGVLSRYTVAEDGKSLNLCATLSMTGSDLKHLNNPSDIVNFNGKTLIADTGNNRIIELSDDKASLYKSLPSPKRLTVGNGTLYASNDYTVYIVSDFISDSTFTFDQKIIDIAYLDMLCILTENGIYTLSEGHFLPVAVCADGKALTTAENGKFLYVMFDDGISIFDNLGKLMPFSLPCDFSDATDFAVDYPGNIFVLFNDKLVTFKNEITGLTSLCEYPISSDFVEAHAKSMFVDTAGVVYFVTQESFAGKTAVTYVSEKYYSYDPPVISSDAVQNFYKPLNANNALLISVDGVIDNCKIYSGGSPIIIFGEVSGFATNYALIGKELYIVDSSNFEKCSPTAINKKYLTIDTAVLYRFPSSESGNLTVEANKIITVEDDAAKIGDGKWYRVRYEDTLYYMSVYDARPYTEDVPDIEKKYGKITASRVGGVVKMYSFANTESEVLVELTDGTKVEILDADGEFYYVAYGSTKGYVLKSELNTDGLTTVQLIAIILSAIVLAAGAVVFVAVYKTRRDTEKKK